MFPNYVLRRPILIKGGTTYYHCLCFDTVVCVLPFFIYKNFRFQSKFLVKTKGGTTWHNRYCGPPFGPFQNFSSSKCSSKAKSNSIRIETYFLSKPKGGPHDMHCGPPFAISYSSISKRMSFNVWFFCQNQRGDHMTCILTVVPPLVHFKIFFPQNLPPNHPILIETISFDKNKHFFILKTSISIFEFFVKTKGGTTWHAYCGPPFGPFQNFLSSKSSSKPSNSNRYYFLW